MFMYSLMAIGPIRAIGLVEDSDATLVAWSDFTFTSHQVGKLGISSAITKGYEGDLIVDADLRIT